MSSPCFSQSSNENYIRYYNYANEAEYYFHEQNYDSAVYYFERGFDFINEPHPNHHHKYAKALWKIGRKKESLLELENNKGISQMDTNWFLGLKKELIDQINGHLHLNLTVNREILFVRAFIDSIMIVDQAVRQLPIDDADHSTKLRVQDSLNEKAVIEFTKKYGFPGGKNTGWDQTVATYLLHVSPEWIIENYTLLLSEVMVGNLEPSALARGIDRKFSTDIDNEKITPYNRYWADGDLHPFLVFQNCKALGVSPYYDYNWLSTPRKTIHFEYYKKNKAFYSTVEPSEIND